MRASSHIINELPKVLSGLMQGSELMQGPEIDRAAAALMTFVPDALGRPTEFSTLDMDPTNKGYLFPMLEGGLESNLRCGQWTDDASQAACWMMALVQAKHIKEIQERAGREITKEQYHILLTNLFARLLYRWFKQGLNSGLDMQQQQQYGGSIGCGGVVRQFMIYWEEVEKKHKTTDENSLLKFLFEHDHAKLFAQYCKEKKEKGVHGFQLMAGNAVTMRNGASAVFANSAREAMELALIQSTTTTPDEEGAACAELQAYLAYKGLHNKTKDPEQNKQEMLSQESLLEFLALYEKIHNKQAPKNIIALCLSVPNHLQIDPRKRDWTNWRCPREEYKKDPTAPQGYYGSYSTQGLALVFNTILNTKSYDETMSLLARMGGDADSNCAVASPLAGVLYGFSAIPKEWVKAVNQHALNQRPTEQYDPLTQQAMKLLNPGNTPLNQTKPCDLIEKTLFRAMPDAYQAALAGPVGEVPLVEKKDEGDGLSKAQPKTAGEYWQTFFNDILSSYNLVTLGKWGPGPKGGETQEEKEALDAERKQISRSTMEAWNHADAPKKSEFQRRLYVIDSLSRQPFPHFPLKKGDLLECLFELEFDNSPEAIRFKCQAFCYLQGIEWQPSWKDAKSLAQILVCEQVLSAEEQTCIKEGRLQLWNNNVLEYGRVLDAFKGMNSLQPLTQAEKQGARAAFDNDLRLAYLGPEVNIGTILHRANEAKGRGLQFLLKHGEKFMVYARDDKGQWGFFDIMAPEKGPYPRGDRQYYLSTLPFPNQSGEVREFTMLRLPEKLRSWWFPGNQAVKKLPTDLIHTEKGLMEEHEAKRAAAVLQQQVDALWKAFPRLIRNDLNQFAEEVCKEIYKGIYREIDKDLSYSYNYDPVQWRRKIDASFKENQERLIRVIDELFVLQASGYFKLYQALYPKTNIDWGNLHRQIFHLAHHRLDLAVIVRDEFLVEKYEAKKKRLVADAKEEVYQMKLVVIKKKGDVLEMKKRVAEMKKRVADGGELAPEEAGDMEADLRNMADEEQRIAEDEQHIAQAVQSIVNKEQRIVTKTAAFKLHLQEYVDTEKDRKSPDGQILVYGQGGCGIITVPRFEKLLQTLTGDNGLRVSQRSRSKGGNLELRIYPTNSNLRMFNEDLVSSYDENCVPYYDIRMNANFRPEHPSATLYGLKYGYKDKIYSLAPPRLVDHLSTQEITAFAEAEKDGIYVTAKTGLYKNKSQRNLEGSAKKLGCSLFHSDTKKGKTIISRSRELSVGEDEGPGSLLKGTSESHTETSESQGDGQDQEGLEAAKIQLDTALRSSNIIKRLQNVNQYFLTNAGETSGSTFRKNAHSTDFCDKRKSWQTILKAMLDCIKEGMLNEGTEITLVGTLQELHGLIRREAGLFRGKGLDKGKQRYHDALIQLGGAINDAGQDLTNLRLLFPELKYRVESYQQLYNQMVVVEETAMPLKNVHAFFGSKVSEEQRASIAENVTRQHHAYALLHENLLRGEEQGFFISPEGEKAVTMTIVQNSPNRSP